MANLTGLWGIAPSPGKKLSEAEIVAEESGGGAEDSPTPVDASLQNKANGKRGCELKVLNLIFCGVIFCMSCFEHTVERFCEFDVLLQIVCDCENIQHSFHVFWLLFLFCC